MKNEDFQKGYLMGLRVAMLLIAEVISDLKNQHDELADMLTSSRALEVPGMVEGLKRRLGL